tara:strand:+ start:143 stop:598 length:456 start_codon:yes stop_codon:yes gene_type:complete
MVNFENLFHIGIIVPNIELGMQELSSRFGVTWPRQPRTSETLVRTKAGTSPITISGVYSTEGPPWFEVFEAVPGTLWASQTSNIHHMGFFVENLDDEIERLVAEGNELEMEAVDENGNRISGCYLNTDLNVRLEIVDASLREKMIERIKNS